MSSMLTDHSLHYITLRYTINMLAIENYPQTHTHIYTHIQSVDKYTRIHNQDTVAQTTITAATTVMI